MRGAEGHYYRCRIGEKEYTVDDIVFKIGPQDQCSRTYRIGKQAVELIGYPEEPTRLPALRKDQLA